MAGRFEGKTVVITGGGSGQGQAGAVLFAREGANLVLVDINEAGLAETAKMVADENPKTEVFTRRTDVTSLDDLDGLVKDVDERFGVIDVVYNNAGVIHFGALEETTPELWDRIHAVNVKGPYFLVQKALPLLKRSEYASVVNVSSGAGLQAPVPGMTVYCSSKGAMIAVTRAMSQDLSAYKIRVNCIVPGLIDTPMSRPFFAGKAEGDAVMVERAMSKRQGTASEVASVAVFLASRDAHYINAASIPVDDGFSVT